MKVLRGGQLEATLTTQEMEPGAVYRHDKLPSLYLRVVVGGSKHLVDMSTGLSIANSFLPPGVTQQEIFGGWKLCSDAIVLERKV